MTQPTATRTIWMSLTILVILVLGISQLLARPATRVDPIEVDAGEVLDETFRFRASNESPFAPTAICGACHVEFHYQWTTGMHYRAWRDPIFQEIYTEYQQYMMSDEEYLLPEEVLDPDLSGRELRRERWRRGHRSAESEESEISVFRIEDNEGEISIRSHGDGLMREGIYDGKIHVNCLRCHAPGADFTEDENLFLENNIDGIFCDYCHTIVDYTPVEGYIIFWSAIKQGPRQYGTTSSHAIEYSRLHEESTFCRGCHQYENPWGFPMYNTYDEWWSSSYANPATTVHCQECHMPGSPGRSGERSDWRPDVAHHTIAGGHNYEFMIETAEVEFTTDVQGDELYIDVDVSNSRAGHNYPSSNGMRQLILIVRLKGSSGETLWQDKRVYERIIGDGDGNPTFAPWRATQVLTDTTLLPGEVRTESFVVAMPETDDSLYVTAQLFYRLTPEGTDLETYLPAPYRIDFATQFLQ